MGEKNLEELINDAHNKSVHVKLVLNLLLNAHFQKAEINQEDKSCLCHNYKTIQTLLELILELVNEVADKAKEAGELRDSCVEE